MTVPAEIADEVGRPLGWLAPVAVGAVSLALLVSGWSVGRAMAWLLAYGGLALGFTVLMLPSVICLPGFRWVYGWTPRLLLLCGALGFGLTALSGNPTIQPVVFTVPLVFAALRYAFPHTMLIWCGYLALMVAGLWLAGLREPSGLLLPTIAYGLLGPLIVGLIEQATKQGAARLRADTLAAELAAERDALRRLAAENERLAQQAAATATLAERNRLARELHDTIAQGLTAVTMQIAAAQRGLDRDPERARQRLGRAHELARATLDSVRSSVWTLAEPLVDGPGLPAALAEQTERFVTRSGTPAAYTHQGPPPALRSASATQVARVAQEALQNAEKHAGAAAVTLRTEQTPHLLRLTVQDDGIGFVVDAAYDGFGLISLRERARLAGGTLQIRSAPGQGTTLELTIPTAAEEPDDADHDPDR